MSVQIYFLKDLQTAISNYLTGYTDSSGNVWPGVLPTFYPTNTPPAIWAFEGGPRPIPPYVSMNYTTTKHIGQGWQSPAVPLRDDMGNLIGYGQGVFWNEDPEISFQGYGAIAPDILGYIHDSLEAPWWYDELENLGLVAREHTSPRDISMIFDNAAPERRWVMDISFGIPIELDQLDIAWIEFVQLTENYAMPDSTPAAPDLVTVSQTIGK
jgi:hypothetical protein